VAGPYRLSRAMGTDATGLGVCRTHCKHTVTKIGSRGCVFPHISTCLIKSSQFPQLPVPRDFRHSHSPRWGGQLPSRTRFPSTVTPSAKSFAFKFIHSFFAAQTANWSVFQALSRFAADCAARSFSLHQKRSRNIQVLPLCVPFWECPCGNGGETRVKTLGR
jgi:hypothetical protein